VPQELERRILESLTGGAKKVNRHFGADTRLAELLEATIRTRARTSQGTLVETSGDVVKKWWQKRMDDGKMMFQ
jgi:hypothetical protein